MDDLVDFLGQACRGSALPACAGTASRVRDVLVIDGLLVRCRRAAAWLCILQQGTCYSGVELVVEVCIHSESTKSQSSSSGEVIEPASARATLYTASEEGREGAALRGGFGR